METLRLRSVSLRVADLDRARAFYVDALGLEPVDDGGPKIANDGGVTGGGERTLALRAPNGARGAGGNAGEAETLIALVETPGVRPKPVGAPGLFHLALLVPDRPSLARVLLRLTHRQIPLHGLSDHGVSEAIYLADPDGNGVEIYVDRPRAGWRAVDGHLEMFTAALDNADLLATAPDGRDAGLPAGTTLGHVHLTVRDLAEAEAFYASPLGLVATSRDYPGAVFLSADGYHHHLALNTWGRRANASANESAASPNHAGLIAIHAAVADLPGPTTLIAPDGVRLELTRLN